MKYSKKNACFYLDDANYIDLPDDLIDVTNLEFEAALSRGPDDALDVINAELVVVPGGACSLEDRKSAALSTIDQWHADAIRQSVGYPTQIEKDTWALKLDVARAIASGQPVNDAEAVFLDAAGIAQCDRVAWAKRVLGLAAAYAGVVGRAEAWRSDARAACQACTDVGELLDKMAQMRNVLNRTVSNLLKV